MLDHAVEVLDEEWRLLSAAVEAHSPFQAVIRAAARGGQYRARAAQRPISESEYFWVPEWGQPVRTEEA